MTLKDKMNWKEYKVTEGYSDQSFRSLTSQNSLKPIASDIGAC